MVSYLLFLIKLYSLGAPHISDSSNRFNYIMEASISNGSDGFGTVSSNTILSFLDKATCDTVQPSGNPPRPSPSPPSVPTPKPPTTTSFNGCSTSPEVDAPKCISVGKTASLTDQSG